MPLTAASPSGLVTAPLLSDPDWERLRQAHKAGAAGLVCRDEGHPMYPRTSRRGLRHFSHHAGVHAGAEETMDHLAVKGMCVRIAHAHGWQATTEYPAPDRSWIADVHATKDGRTIVFEVQWSQQADSQYGTRTRRYLDAGFEVVWLERVRRRSYARVHDGDHVRLPFWKDDADGYVDAAHDPLPLQDRIIDICSGIFAPGPKTEYAALFESDCRKCGQTFTVWWMQDGERLWVEKGRREADPRVVAAVRATAPMRAPLADLASRYSRTAGKSYEAFCCPHCAALQGDYYLHDDFLDAGAEGRTTLVPAIIADGSVWDTLPLEARWDQLRSAASRSLGPVEAAKAQGLPNGAREAPPLRWTAKRADFQSAALPEEVRAELDEMARGAVSPAEHIRNYYARLKDKS